MSSVRFHAEWFRRSRLTSSGTRAHRVASSVAERGPGDVLSTCASSSRVNVRRTASGTARTTAERWARVIVMMTVAPRIISGVSWRAVNCPLSSPRVCNRFAMWDSIGSSARARTPALAEGNEAAGPLFKMRTDPRVTRVGRVLRRYSLDELPQLFNVLCGHMSLVGPRPALPHEAAAYEERMRRRLLVKPGMTGMWQVSGRSDLPWDEAVRLDVYYAENWTPFLDLLILAQTVRAVALGRGAY